VLLFSRTGSLERTWTPGELWGDGEPTDWERDWPAQGGRLHAYLSRQRSIEEVLALPEGPAILVREPSGAGARWRLAVLAPEVEWYDIPAGALPGVARLRGDVDETGRIALVGTPRELYEEAQVAHNELILLRLQHPVS
jgi:hypothetical protein